MLWPSLFTWHWDDISFFQLRGLWFSLHTTKYQFHAVEHRSLLVRFTKSQAPPHRHSSFWNLPVDSEGLQANLLFHSQGSYFRLSVIKQDWRQCIKWTRITRAARPEIHFMSPWNCLEINPNYPWISLGFCARMSLTLTDLLQKIWFYYLTELAFFQGEGFGRWDVGWMKICWPQNKLFPIVLISSE